MTTAGDVPTIFTPFLARWRLLPDGAPIETRSSHLLPVLSKDAPAMLKLLKAESDEAPGIRVLDWFGGDGAVRLLASTEDAVLMERATGSRSLVAMSIGGGDMEAATILADTVARLHRRRKGPFPSDIPTLAERFRALIGRRQEHAALAAAARVAEQLLADPRDIVVLHGDLHHENVLDSPRGWLAIDPKGVVGEATYDIANLFLNPIGAPVLTRNTGRIATLADSLAHELGFERDRILAFAFAHAGLATAWLIEDGLDPREGFAMTEMLSGFIAA